MFYKLLGGTGLEGSTGSDSMDIQEGSALHKKGSCGRVSDPLPPPAALLLCTGENGNVPLTKGDGREAAGGRSHTPYQRLFVQSRKDR